MISEKKYVRLLVMLFFSALYFPAFAFQPHPLSRQDSAMINDYQNKYEDWKERGDLKEASRYLNKIAFIYWEHNYYREAIAFYEKSKEYNLKIGNENGVAMIHNNLAMIYSDLMDYNKSLEYFDKTLVARRSAGEKIGIISALVNRSVVLNNLKQFDESVRSLEEALSLAREDYDLPQMKSCYLMLSETHQKAGNAKESIEYLDLYQQMNKKYQEEIMQRKEKQLENAKLKAKLAETEKRNKELEIAAKNQELKEKDKKITEFSSEKNRLLANLSRRELEVRSLRQEAQLQEQRDKLLRERRDREKKEASMQRVLFGIIFIFVLIVASVLWNSNRLKRRANQLLAQRNKAISLKNRKIEEQNQELNTQKEYLEDTLLRLQQTQEKLIESEKMAALGNLVAGVAHEINTPVGVGITLASDLMNKTENFVDIYKHNKMKRSDLEHFLQNNYEAGKLILSNLERTGRLIQNFRQVSVNESVDNINTFDMVQYIKDLINSLKPKFKNRPIEVVLKGENKLMLKSIPGVFAQIVTNLFVNALRYAFDINQKGLISISINREEKQVILEVQDDGKGISPEVLPKIFEPFFTTDKHQGTGLGLHITYNLVTQKLKGSIECKSKPGEGSCFRIVTPINQ